MANTKNKIVMVEPMAFWMERFDHLSKVEGWSLFDADGVVTIMRIDDQGDHLTTSNPKVVEAYLKKHKQLTSDRQAMQIVTDAALRGSVMHLTALYFEGRPVKDEVDLLPVAYSKAQKPQNRLWVRVGDGGEYEQHGQDLDAVIDVLFEAGVRGDDLQWAHGCLATEVYAGQNYISLFWGDANSNIVKGLTKVQQAEIKRKLLRMDRVQKQSKVKSAF